MFTENELNGNYYSTEAVAPLDYQVLHKVLLYYLPLCSYIAISSPEYHLCRDPNSIFHNLRPVHIQTELQNCCRAPFPEQEIRCCHSCFEGILSDQKEHLLGLTWFVVLLKKKELPIPEFSE